MAMRLETVQGAKKTYRTSFGVDSFEPVYVQGIHKSKCGREWKGEPTINEECDHLECAIWANEQYSRTFKRLSLIMIGIGLICMLLSWAFGSEVSYAFGLFGMCSAVVFGLPYIYYQFKVLHLKEFENKGTICGVKAHQIKEIKDLP
jgi:hypothetical protein